MLESAVAKLKANGVRSQGKILDQTNVALALTNEADKGTMTSSWSVAEVKVD